MGCGGGSLHALVQPFLHHPLLLWHRLLLLLQLLLLLLLLLMMVMLLLAAAAADVGAAVDAGVDAPGLAAALLHLGKLSQYHQRHRNQDKSSNQTALCAIPQTEDYIYWDCKPTQIQETMLCLRHDRRF